MVAKAGDAIRTAWPVGQWSDSQSPSPAFGLPLLDTGILKLL